METEVDDAFVIDGDLTAMAGLSDWVDALVERHSLPEKIQFAAKLCLEESVSNSIRHGYQESGRGQVRVRFSGSKEHGWLCTVDDDAPHYNPLEQPELPAIRPDTFEVGGQGIRLMRAFATSLRYEATDSGNRILIGFGPVPDEAV